MRACVARAPTLHPFRPPRFRRHARVCRVCFGPVGPVAPSFFPSPQRAAYLIIMSSQESSQCVSVQCNVLGIFRLLEFEDVLAKAERPDCQPETSSNSGQSILDFLSVVSFPSLPPAAANSPYVAANSPSTLHDGVGPCVSYAQSCISGIHPRGYQNLVGYADCP